MQRTAEPPALGSERPTGSLFPARLGEGGSPRSWGCAREPDTAASEQEEENQAATKDAHTSSKNFLLLDF